MLILFSKLNSLPVIELEGQQKVAVLSDVVVEPKDGKVLGLIVKVGGLISKDQLIASRDITQLLSTAVLIGNADKISDINEVIRVHELYKKKFGLINRNVKTKSGKYLGRVNDFLINDETLCLAKIYVRHLLSDRIIPYNAIIKIDHKGIVVKDDFEALAVMEQSDTVGETELA